MTIFLDVAKRFIHEKIKNELIIASGKNSGTLSKFFRGVPFSRTKISFGEKFLIDLMHLEDSNQDEKNKKELKSLLVNFRKDSKKRCDDAGISPQNLEKALKKCKKVLTPFYNLIMQANLLDIQPECFSSHLDATNHPTNYKQVEHVFYHHAAYYFIKKCWDFETCSESYFNFWFSGSGPNQNIIYLKDILKNFQVALENSTSTTSKNFTLQQTILGLSDSSCSDLKKIMEEAGRQANALSTLEAQNKIEMSFVSKEVISSPFKEVDEFNFTIEDDFGDDFDQSAKLV